MSVDSVGRGAGTAICFDGDCCVVDETTEDMVVVAVTIADRWIGDEIGAFILWKVLVVCGDEEMFRVETCLFSGTLPST